MEQTHSHHGKSSELFLEKDIILKSLQIKPGQNILDAGCGNGYMAKEFSKIAGNTGKVFAIDIHKDSIKQLQSETAKSNIIAIAGDITKNIPIEESSIDIIYLSTVFHGFTSAEKDGFLKNTKRILKPGGLLAIVEINKIDTPFGPPIEIRYSPEELTKAVGLNKKDLIKIGDFFICRFLSFKKWRQIMNRVIIYLCFCAGLGLPVFVVCGQEPVLVTHSQFQAVHSDGSSSFDDAGPVEVILEGILLNNPEDWLDPYT